MTADHQLAGERPGLAGDVDDVAHAHPRLLVNLARHRFLDRLARLDEAGERAEAARGKARLAAEQQARRLPLAVRHQHDRDRIGARKMLRVAPGAFALPAAFGDPRALPAHGAEAVPGMPIDQAARPAIDREIARFETLDRRPQARVERAGTAGFRHRGEVRPLLMVEAEKHQFGIGRRFGQRGPDEPSVLADRRVEPVEREQPRAQSH